MAQPLRAGAKGYLPKNTAVPKLIELLRGVERDEPALPAHMTVRLLQALAHLPQVTALEHQDGAPLTARELDVVHALGSGATNRQIAERLYIIQYTVKSQVRKILAKLGVRSRAEAAALARRRPG